jgi:hypothetical protein
MSYFWTVTFSKKSFWETTGYLIKRLDCSQNDQTKRSDRFDYYKVLGRFKPEIFYKIIIFIDLKFYLLYNFRELKYL